VVDALEELGLSSLPLFVPLSGETLAGEERFAHAATVRPWPMAFAQAFPVRAGDSNSPPASASCAHAPSSVAPPLTTRFSSVKAPQEGTCHPTGQYLVRIFSLTRTVMWCQVFPEHVTQKLKHGEAVISEAHDCVTVHCRSHPFDLPPHASAPSILGPLVFMDSLFFHPRSRCCSRTS
jgi:hypothetical protein